MYLSLRVLTSQESTPREKELRAITEFCVRCGRSHSRSRVAYRFSDKVTSKPVSALSRPDNWSATMDLTSTAGGSGSLPIPDLSPASVWVVPPPREIWYFQLNSPPGQTWVPLSFVPLIVQHLVNLHNLSWDHLGGVGLLDGEEVVSVTPPEIALQIGNYECSVATSSLSAEANSIGTIGGLCKTNWFLMVNVSILC